MQPSRRKPGLGLFLLLYQVFGVFGIRDIPLATLCLVALHSAIFLRLFKLPWSSPSDVCVSIDAVWNKGDYSRLLYAAFEHGDEWHLYYNMISFVFKGRALEKIFGSFKFLYLVAMFTILTDVTIVGLCAIGSQFDPVYTTECSIGFSGVVFALKVLTTYYYPDDAYQAMGIPILLPANCVVWVELILIQLIAPNASFMGHLAGILVGLSYVKGPLGPILNYSYSLPSGMMSAVSWLYHAVLLRIRPRNSVLNVG